MGPGQIDDVSAQGGVFLQQGGKFALDEFRRLGCRPFD
jgi:hypothetical protein